MRIIAGRFRGKSIKAPSDNSIRPTADRVRENLFNILSSRIGPTFEGLHALDLFAGTGALGLEALSRGAQFVTFVEMGAEARGLIREHIETFGIGGISKLLRRDATDMGPVGNATPAALVFVDPPYNQGLGERAMQSALAGGWIAPDATIVLEESRSADIELGEGFELIDRRDYGSTSLHFITPANQ